jgi:hypothetical protein
MIDLQVLDMTSHCQREGFVDVEKFEFNEIDCEDEDE